MTALRKTFDGDDRMRLEGSQETLLITLYAKALDNRSDTSILHDALADDTVRRIQYDFERFGLGPREVASLALRSRIIDRWTTAYLQSRKDALVLHLACGLDSRVFRVDPSLEVDWIDVDFPEVIRLRKELLPARAGRYRMLATNVLEGDWLEQIESGRPAVVIAEGLLPYLDEADARRLVQRVVEHFPEGQLLCDTYNSLALKLLQYAPMIRATHARVGDAGIADPDTMQRWHPRLQFIDEPRYSELPEVAALPARFRAMCWIYDRSPWMRNLGRVARFRF